jgi:hypothetical protein
MKMNRHGLTYLPEDHPYSQLVATQVDDDLTPLLDKFNDKFAPIASDSKLTASGKQYARRKLGAETHDAIDKLHAHRRKKLDADTKALNLPTRLPTTTELAKRRGEDPMVVHSQLSELRAHIRGRDPVENRVLLSNDPDIDTLLACCGCHLLVRPVPDNVADAAVKAYLTNAAGPEASAVRDALLTFNSNAAVASKHVTDKTGINRTDAVQRAAAADPTAQPPEVG